jgi:branched-chain amino acid transport system permease protein
VPDSAAVVAPAAQARAQRMALFGENRRNRVLFLVFLALALVYPALDQTFSWQRMGSMNPILIYVILALGLNIVVGYAGLLDLGYAAFFAIGGYTVAFLTAPQSPLPFRTDFWPALGISWCVAAIFGVILGAPTLRLRGDYLAIVTLAFGEIVPRAFLNLEKWSNGAKGMNPIGRPHLGEKELLASDQVQWYYLILAVLLVSVFLIVRLHGSRLGRAWMAMREDEAAAASMGIDLVKTKLLAFALGASFSGFAGSMYASMLQFIDPFQFDFSISVIVLSMVILGGIGNVWGVMVGAVVMGIFNFIVTDAATPWIRAFGSLINVPVVSPWLQGVDLSSAKLLMFGLVLVLLMAIRPQGLFPSMQRRSELLEADPAAPVPPTTMEPVGATRTH